MNKFTNALTALWTEDEGLTVVEYAIAGGLIGAAVIVAFTNLGITVGKIIAYIDDTLKANTPAA
ncbi:MAG: Flp family type IVb pilin [Steroidobacteraceae bacterium]